MIQQGVDSWRLSGNLWQKFSAGELWPVRWVLVFSTSWDPSPKIFAVEVISFRASKVSEVMLSMGIEYAH